MTNDKDDVIESTAEESGSNETEELIVAPEDINDKKSSGGFFRFLSFVFSLAALGLSAYLLMQSQNQPAPQQSWKQPLEQANSQWQQSQAGTKQQLQSIQQTQGKLQQQISTLQDSLKALQQSPHNNSSESQNNTAEFNQQLNSLVQKVADQDQQIQSMSAQLQLSQQQQSEQLKDLQEMSSSQQIANPQPPASINFPLLKAETHMQYAAMFLQVQADKSMALKEMEKAKAELQTLPGQKTQNLVFELTQTMQLISEVPTLDVGATSRQLDLALQEAQKLGSNTSSEEKQEDQGSWYEKLIVIRKVDDSEEKKLSATEVLVLKNQLISHFDLLRLALYAKNQQQWLAHLSRIEELIAKNYPQSGENLNTQLQELKAVKFEADFPAISGLIESLSGLNEDQ